ncbi:MAG: DUF6036 family nucleotidyltransferase [Myxococcota bacterium]|jgi:hypothetical protein
MTNYPPRKRFLDQREIDAGMAEIADIARAERLRVLLIGGCALQFYGSDRLTADIDVAAERLPDSLPAEEALTFGGVQTHTPGGVPVDWIVRADDYAKVFEEALEFPRRIEGLPLPVASPEYLVVMKMVARRKKDAADLEALLQSDLVDLDKARGMVKRLLGAYAADEFDAVLASAQWERSRRKT